MQWRRHGNQLVSAQCKMWGRKCCLYIWQVDKAVIHDYNKVNTRNMTFAGTCEARLDFLVLVYSLLGRTHKPHKCFVWKFSLLRHNTDVHCPVWKTQQGRSQLKCLGNVLPDRMQMHRPQGIRPKLNVKKLIVFPHPPTPTTKNYWKQFCLFHNYSMIYSCKYSKHP